MAWTRLTNSTTADADEVHADFVEIRSGSLLPMKLSTSASTTDGAYDLGSSTKSWRKLYVGSVSADYVKGVPQLIWSANTTGVIEPEVSISVGSSINGDIVDEYLIKIRATQYGAILPTKYCFLKFNGDTGSNYHSNVAVNYANKIISTTTSFCCAVYTCTTLADTKYILNININPKTSDKKYINCHGEVHSEGILYPTNAIGYWATASTITSMQISFNNTLTSGYDIQLYAVYK
jgi:hypothetical protein